MRRKTTSLLLIGLLFLISCVNLQPASAVSRGEMAEVIIKTLDLPRWTGQDRFSDVPTDHPFFSAIETARAYGIIFPGEKFHPDLEATRIEALHFAFKAMGWSHEAEIAQFLAPQENEDIPPFMLPSLSLGALCSPLAPQPFINFPRQNLEREDLAELANWLYSCRRSMIWDQTFYGEHTSLRIHREKVGTPPISWAIFITETPDATAAQKIEAELSQKGLSAFIINSETTYTVYTGPYSNFVKAWEIFETLPTELGAKIVPHSQQKSEALFWAALQTEGIQKTPTIITAPSLGQPLLPLKHMTDKTRAEAAINGGFFSSRKPIGTLIVRGIPLSPSYAQRSAMGWTEEGATFWGNGEFRALLRDEYRIAPITDLNSVPPENGLGLFSSIAGQFFKPLPLDSVLYLFGNDSISEAGSLIRSQRAVPDNSLLLAARGIGIDMIKSFISERKTISMEIEWRDPSMDGSYYALQGGPMLLKDGQLQTRNEGFSQKLREEKHPRTIVGTDGQKVWWIVIDGRNPWHSGGATLLEAARLANDLGLSTVLNLDGGGSSELVWKGQIINAIPGGRERPLPYGIFFAPSTTGGEGSPVS